MMVDASALCAVLFQESDADIYWRAMLEAKICRMATVTWFEASMAVERYGDAVALQRFEEIVAELRIALIDFTEAHAAEARKAWKKYGRGASSPAKLNFGDCMAYAVAKLRDEPLLFKGNDFVHTDIESALKG